MNTKVRAAVATAANKTEIREYDIPQVPSDGGLLSVETVGVCGTDVANYRAIKEPRILGHHVIGFIARIGNEATKRWGLRDGDRVAMEEYLPCGQCKACRRGRYRACSATDSHRGGLRYGNTPVSLSPSLWGGFAEFMYLHPHAVLHLLPAHVDSVEAALTLPLANGFEWMVSECGVTYGQIVVIHGPGQQGLACLLAAKSVGATVVVAGRETSLHRLELARQLGADVVVNMSRENLIERVREISGGDLADVAIDVTSGGAKPVEQSIAVVHRGGVVALAAYKHETMPDWDIDQVVAKELTVKGLRGHSHGSVEMAIDCISNGRFPVRLLNSHHFGLEETDLALRTAGGDGAPRPLLVAVSPRLHQGSGPSHVASAPI